ncbi:MAG: hypothetical protein WHT08_14745 [Bryobacteraceae bacterium]
MTLPKELERETPVTGSHPSAPPAKQAGESRSEEPRTGWQMPGGEDLLNFALSAGLAAGAWWLEMQQEPAGAAGETGGEPAGGRRTP